MKSSLGPLQILFVIYFHGLRIVEAKTETYVTVESIGTTARNDFPEGYSILPGDNVAYKIYKDRMTWEEARARCVLDGGHLTIADTYDKIQRLNSSTDLSDVKGFLFVGIRRHARSKKWIRVDNEKPVKSMPWGHFPTLEGMACAVMIRHIDGLWDTNCREPLPSICEIPIDRNNTNTDDTVSDNAESIDATTPVSSSTIIPERYSLIPGDNVTLYKLYKDSVSWDNARDRCISDGGHLAIIDSYDKIKRINNIDRWYSESISVGFHKPVGSREWIRVDNGQAFRPMPWNLLPEMEGRACAIIPLTFNDRLSGIMCDEWTRGSVCEISIGEKNLATNFNTTVSEDAAEESFATTEAPPPGFIPEGYSTLPGDNVAYKIYTDMTTFDEARTRCILDGGHLAIADTFEKVQRVKSVGNYITIDKTARVGILKPIGSEKWIRVDNGVPLTWMPREISNNRNPIGCATLRMFKLGLWINFCESKLQSVCEISLIESQFLLANNTSASRSDESLATMRVPLPGFLPEGYLSFFGENVAYKIYKNGMTWEEARIQCVTDGGNLAIADTVDKIKNIKRVGSGVQDWSFVGFNKSRGYQPWIRVDNGQVARSLPFENHLNSGNCAMLLSAENKLDSVRCETKLNSVCEIPTSENYFPTNITIAKKNGSLPEGYLISRVDKVAYKIYADLMTWKKARFRCISDGGDLAIANTVDKIQRIQSIHSGVKTWLFVGIYKPQRYREWFRVDNGLQFPSMPWELTTNIDVGVCGIIMETASILSDVGCELKLQSVCEIQMNDELSVNGITAS